jgi:small subunit ribosomal protein S2
MLDLVTTFPEFANLEDKAPEFDLTELLEAGCHFGHHKSKWHPKMNEWIYTEKDGVHIFDLVKTVAQLKVAYNIAYNLGSKGKTLVVVGTKRQASGVIEELLKTYKFMNITSRWLGGLLTNWSQVFKSLNHMLEIEKGLETDKYKGYTKYEKGQLAKEMTRLKRFFEGLRELKKKPDCIFVVDPKKEKNLLKEARQEGVLVMALIDSNTNPDGVDVVIPANDDAVKSIQYITEAVVKGYTEGMKSKKGE